jgi:SRSO17 transposase
MVVDESWRTDLERWLAPFLAGLSHQARRRMCPQYIAGLIGPGDRKSVQPMAARGGEAGYDQLHLSSQREYGTAPRSRLRC